MASLSANRLSPLQRDLLEAFFRHESRFHLTGGAALAGYYLGHRDTADLDLFTSVAAIDEGEAALRAAVGDVGASVENVQTAPDFRRRLVRRERESVVVDLVVDATPQGPQPKKQFGGVRVDPPEEILANKLCTLLSRAELRDLVDVLALERAGFRTEDAVPLASGKDAGLTPAQLAWVLSQITIGDDAAIPGGVSAAELRSFLASLIARLTHLSFPR
jgi:Nucleotidyl transferase AbiEii toxin, Type IV TA system